MGSDAGLTLRIAEIPERLARSRPPGTLGGFVGGLCLTVGYVSLAFFVFLIATPSRNVLTYYWAALPSAGVVGVSFLIAGTRLVRGRRRLVLFLRRFGLTSSTEAITRAIWDGLGKRWRIVTLDDYSVAAVGVDRKARRRLRQARYLTVIVAVLLAVAMYGYFYAWFQANKGLMSDFQEIGSTMALVLVAAVGTVLISVFALTLWAVLVSSSWIARSADRSKAVVIARREEILPVANRLAVRARRVFSARLAVVRVENAYWRDVVEYLVILCDAVVVDISSASPNLTWEIQTLTAQGKRWVPVGQFDRLLALQQDSSPDALGVRRVVGSHVVLAYRDGRSLALARTLEAALNSSTA